MQGGTADKELFVLGRNEILSRTFLVCAPRGNEISCFATPLGRERMCRHILYWKHLAEKKSVASQHRSGAESLQANSHFNYVLSLTEDTKSFYSRRCGYVIDETMA